MKAAIYARVSTREQTVEQQESACRKYCEARGWDVATVVVEVASTRTPRPKRQELLASLRRLEYDALVVFKLDRWARDLDEFCFEVEDLEERGVQIVSLHDTIDTTTAMGRAMFQLAGVFAQLERDLHAEATRDRLAALKRMGVKLGRPPKILGEAQSQILSLVSSGQSMRATARQLQLGSTTVRRVVTDHVRRMAQAGAGVDEICQSTGLPPGAIDRILSGGAPKTPPEKGAPIHAPHATKPETPFMAQGEER